jgi:enoyl-CoA hydratase/carnithine racemase
MSGAAAPRVTFAASDGVGTVLLTRPPVNALDERTAIELAAVAEEIERSDRVRAVVIAGSDQVFSAGVDVRAIQGEAPADVVALVARFQSVYMSWERLRVPTVAAIEGYALGGGCELALACDIRVAAADAVLGLPEVNLGSVPGIGGMQRLSRLVGIGTAKRMVLSGERVDAADCWRIGLVEEVARPGSAVAAALRLARTIADKPALATRAAKEAINDGADLSLERALRLDLRHTRVLAGSADRAECLLAFLEKRAPRLVDGPRS